MSYMLWILCAWSGCVRVGTLQSLPAPAAQAGMAANALLLHVVYIPLVGAVPAQLLTIDPAPRGPLVPAIVPPRETLLFHSFRRHPVLWLFL